MHGICSHKVLHVWHSICERVAERLVLCYQLRACRLVSVAGHRTVDVRFLELLDRFDEREQVCKVICCWRV